MDSIDPANIVAFLRADGTPAIIIEGKTIVVKKIPVDPDAVPDLCGGCASLCEGSCSWRNRHIAPLGNVSVPPIFLLKEPVRAHLGPCSSDYWNGSLPPGIIYRYVYAEVPGSSSPKKEKGYSPDTFVSGDKMQELTRILCR